MGFRRRQPGVRYTSSVRGMKRGSPSTASMAPSYMKSFGFHNNTIATGCYNSRMVEHMLNNFHMASCATSAYVWIRHGVCPGVALRCTRNVNGRRTCAILGNTILRCQRMNIRKTGWVLVADQRLPLLHIGRPSFLNPDKDIAYAIHLHCQ